MSEEIKNWNPSENICKGDKRIVNGVVCTALHEVAGDDTTNCLTCPLYEECLATEDEVDALFDKCLDSMDRLYWIRDEK